VINCEKFLRVEGVLQNQDHTISIKASRVLPISITAAETQSHDFHLVSPASCWRYFGHPRPNTALLIKGLSLKPDSVATGVILSPWAYEPRFCKCSQFVLA
jgi:hypothetical protein